MGACVSGRDSLSTASVSFFFEGVTKRGALGSRFSLLDDLSSLGPADRDLVRSWGLCRDMLAFVGDANDGRLIEVCTASRGPDNRLGVLGALLGIAGSGDNLRRFAGEDAIEESYAFQYIYMTSIPLSTSTRAFDKFYEELWARAVVGVVGRVLVYFDDGRD